MKKQEKEVLSDVLFALKAHIKVVRQAAFDKINSAKRFRLQDVVQGMEISIDKIENLSYFRPSKNGSKPRRTTRYRPICKACRLCVGMCESCRRKAEFYHP